MNVTDRYPFVRRIPAMIVLAILPLQLWAQGDSLSGADTSAETYSVSDTVADSVQAEEPRLFVYDSSTFTPRVIPDGELNDYREDSDFDYARKTAPSASFFERLLQWLGDLLGPVLGNESGRIIFQYGIFGAALVLVVVLLMRSELGGIFKRRAGKNKGLIEFEEVEEDLTRMDFDALISEAITAGNLRRAVRLHYLKLLREMTERGLIEWRREKTNSDYLYELNRQDLRPRFAELTRIFDYVWYGGVDIDMGHYRGISDSFGTFTQTVQRVA